MEATLGLFLDDERFPPRDIDWFIARSVDEAKLFIINFGLPKQLSLDHDLGEGVETGYDFVKWLVDQDLDGILSLKNVSSFYVHSQNPVGAANMNSYWNSYWKFLNCDQNDSVIDRKRADRKR